jgi:integrase
MSVLVGRCSQVWMASSLAAASRRCVQSASLPSLATDSPLDPRLPRRFKVQSSKAGVPVVSAHSTRRTCASLLVVLDVHPRVAMQILRHSRISITMGPLFTGRRSEHSRSSWAIRHHACDQELGINCCTLLLQKF